jgi:hypothetical protein
LTANDKATLPRLTTSQRVVDALPWKPKMAPPHHCGFDPHALAMAL